MRLGYPESIKIIRVPCTGKVDALHLQRCFERGADGVLVVGCREGDCHYQSGNFRARKRVEEVGRLLERIGIGGARLRMVNLSSSDAPLFVQAAREIHEAVLAAGPSPVGRPRRRPAAPATPEPQAKEALRP